MAKSKKKGKKSKSGIIVSPKAKLPVVEGYWTKKRMREAKPAMPMLPRPPGGWPKSPDTDRPKGPPGRSPSDPGKKPRKPKPPPKGPPDRSPSDPGKKPRKPIPLGRRKKSKSASRRRAATSVTRRRAATSVTRRRAKGKAEETGGITARTPRDWRPAGSKRGTRALKNIYKGTGRRKR